MKKIFLTIIMMFGVINAASGENVELFKVNNIKVLYKQSKNLPVVCVRAFTNVSASGEGAAGLASLTSRLMAKSTTHRTAEQLSKDIDAIGASLETATEDDFSVISISSLSAYFDGAAEILADVIINPAFNDFEINLEKQNTLAALISRKDSISKTARDAFYAKYYDGTPFAYPILGTPESVKALTPEELKSWHEKAYTSNTMLICVVGDVTKAQVKQTVKKYFSTLPEGKSANAPKIVFQNFTNENIDISGKFQQAYIFKGYTAPGFKDKDFITLKVINAVLGARMTARLFVELREKLGLAYEVNAIYPSSISRSYFGVYMGLDKKNIALANAKMEEVMIDLTKNKISAEELRNVKNYISGIYLLDRQTVSRQSYYLGMREITGQGFSYDKKYLKLISKVTSDDILKAAKKYFKVPSVTVTVKPNQK
jgi:predicted Zn-dependent peptidase